MEMTKTTTIVWASEADQGNSNLNTAREAKIDQMMQAGLTNGVYTAIDPVTTVRYWINQNSAEEFISFIMAQAELYNCSILSTLINDYTAPV